MALTPPFGIMKTKLNTMGTHVSFISSGYHMLQCYNPYLWGIKLIKPFIVSHGLLVGVDLCHGLSTLDPTGRFQKIRSVPLSRRQLSLDLTRLHQGQPFWLEGEKTREGENGFFSVRCLHPRNLT